MAYSGRPGAGAGAQAAGVYLQSREGAESLAREWSALGPRCIALQADVTDQGAIARMTARMDPAQVETSLRTSALGKPVERDGVARQVVEFCRSDSTTGQVLVVDSGIAYH